MVEAIGRPKWGSEYLLEIQRFCGSPRLVFSENHRGSFSGFIFWKNI
jgi:hypothetical protein